MEPTIRPSTLDELLVKTSRTFALSIPALPEPTRREVTVAYLLFRVADTLEDATAWSVARKREELAALDALLRQPSPAAARELAGRWAATPPLDHDGYRELLGCLPQLLQAFEGLAPPARELVARHTLRTVERMVDFVARGAGSGQLELRDVAELRDYCYAVAGIVGEMLTELFLLGRDELVPIAPELRARAVEFGEALQLVNILKDAAADAGEGRRFLPPGVPRGAVFELARRDLAAATGYVRALHTVGAARGLVEFTALPVLLARATLDHVERHGPSSRLSRADVALCVVNLQRALDRGAVPL